MYGTHKNTVHSKTVFCCHLVVRRDATALINVEASPECIFNDTVFLTLITLSLPLEQHEVQITTLRPDSLCTQRSLGHSSSLSVEVQVIHQTSRQCTREQVSAQFFCSLASVTE